MAKQDLEKAFVIESNRIEGITRDPTPAELTEFSRFMALSKITVEELQRFVSIYQPGAILRDLPGLNVQVGNHLPPRGGPMIRAQLMALLMASESLGAYKTHIQYETIHPFTDGNGRSGRMLWAWQTRNLSLGFLHHFYYQTLADFNSNPPPYCR